MRTPILRPSTAAQQGDMERRVAAIEQAISRLSAPVQQRPASTTNIAKQASHGLAVGDVIRHDGSAWVKSQATTATASVVGGIVIAVLSPGVFVMATGGYVSGLSGLTAGSVHYLDPTTAGLLTTTAPTGTLPIIPVLLAISATECVLLSFGRAPQTVGFIAQAYGLGYSRTSSGSLSAPVTWDSGVAYVILVGAGGAGGTTGNQRVQRYVSTTSGGSVTTALTICRGGDGGGAGALTVCSVAVVNGDTINATVGAGGSGAGGTTTMNVNGGSTMASAGGGSAGSAGGAGGFPVVNVGVQSNGFAPVPLCLHVGAHGLPGNVAIDTNAAGGATVHAYDGSNGNGGNGAQMSTTGTLSGAANGTDGAAYVVYAA